MINLSNKTVELLGVGNTF